MMQTAFNTSGKLTGAQNVGYFFSDGKPTTGQEIGTADETALKNFLDANNIKNYAIGLGSGVSNANLDPLAYDGISHTNTNAVVVPTSISSTRCCPALWKVRQSPVRCWARAVLRRRWRLHQIHRGRRHHLHYDPRANSGQGSLTASGNRHGTFNTVNNTISIATNNSARW
jgi:hypothetical protein